jgi:hypothetical protein
VAGSATILAVRPVVVVSALLLAACRRDAHTGAVPASGSGRTANAPRAGATLTVTDDELAAFTRWQRDYVDLFRQHWEELDAVGKDDPSAAMRDPKAFEARVAEIAARQAPAMKALLDRVPLKGEKAELVTEATGGIFHVDRGHKLVIVRDEVRLDAARRRFGQKPIDDIVAREPLILAALQSPSEKEPAR